MLESVTPEQAQGADTTLLRGMLETSSKRLVDGTVADELTAAELHFLVGGVYRSLGLLADAERHLPAAVELHTRLLGEEHPSTLQSVGALANLRQEQGRYPEAEALLQRALQLEQQVLGEEHPDPVNTMGNLATLYTSQGRHAEAEILFQRGLGLAQRVFGAEDQRTLFMMSNLANLYAGGRGDEAEALYVRVLEIKRRVLGEMHPATLRTTTNLAVLYAGQGRRAEAEAISCRTWQPSGVCSAHITATRRSPYRAWRCSTARRADTPRPRHCTSTHWRA